MHLLTFIFGIVLLPKGKFLFCYLHFFSHCFKSFDLSPGSSENATVNMKSCVLADECVEGSVNFGISRIVFMSKCCSSDLCNNQALPDPGKSIPNGRKCYQCNEETCAETLHCLGNEEHCVSATVTVVKKIVWKGCASKQICSNIHAARLSGTIAKAFSCCQGDYCNSASSTGAGLLLLVAPLVSLVAFS
uniref:UPAR/Ly6 domain-containing protein n=1 Tax=Mola mola TaxID=94237 RepID=A0A3Q4BL76_MOLML